MIDFLRLTVELTVGLAALLVVTKTLGPTQIGQLTPFHFISALVLGELLGNAVYEEDTGIFHVLYALTVWGVLLVLLETVSRKFAGLRTLIQGQPAIVIRKGLLQPEVLRRNRVNLNELQMLLRKQGVFSVRQVEYAILELDGSVTLLKKPVHDTPTKQELNLPPKQGQLPVTFIGDGVIFEDNLTASGFNLDWLRSQLAAQGVTDHRNVFFAEWPEGEGLLVQRYDQKVLPPV